MTQFVYNVTLEATQILNRHSFIARAEIIELRARADVRLTGWPADLLGKNALSRYTINLFA